MSKKIKAFIVGLGQIGMMYDELCPKENYYISHAKALRDHKDFEIVGAVEPDIAKRNIFIKCFCKNVFSSIYQNWDYLNPDLLIISSPTETHLEVLEESLKCSSIKTILCEKPLSNSVDEAKKMVKLCDSNKIKLFINYVRRADPACLKIREMIANKKIEMPIKGFCWYTKGLKHIGSHFIDLLSFWLGEIEDFKLINCSNKSDLKDDLVPEFMINFQKGSIIFQSGWDKYFFHYSIEMICKNGRLRYDLGGSIIWQGLCEDVDFPGDIIIDPQEIPIENEMHKYQLNIFNLISDFFRNKKICLNTGKESIKILETIQKIQDLAES